MIEPAPHVEYRSRSPIILTTLAFVSGTIEIAAQCLDSPTLVYIFKPLAMIYIIGIALIGVSESLSYRRLVVAGLAFSLVGDVLLMLPTDQFVPGLVSFLIAHLLYIAAFRTRPMVRLSGLLGLGCVAYGCVMLWLLFPYLRDMKLPVSIYLIVILSMVWQALSRWAVTRTRPALLAALGATIFVLSDSMIAINRFYGRFRLADPLIMLTYFVAQWLIARSVDQRVVVSRVLAE